MSGKYLWVDYWFLIEFLSFRFSTFRQFFLEISNFIQILKLIHNPKFHRREALHLYMAKLHLEVLPIGRASSSSSRPFWNQAVQVSVLHQKLFPIRSPQKAPQSSRKETGKRQHQTDSQHSKRKAWQKAEQSCATTFIAPTEL